jgi:hypothetical protein
MDAKEGYVQERDCAVQDVAALRVNAILVPDLFGDLIEDDTNLGQVLGCRVGVRDGDEEVGCVWVAVNVMNRFVEEVGDATDEVSLARHGLQSSWTAWGAMVSSCRGHRSSFPTRT